MARAGAQQEIPARNSPSLGQDQAPAAKGSGPTRLDLFPMQFLLFPEVLHFPRFLTKGLRQLDVTLPLFVYLCKEKLKIYVYIPKMILLIKSAVAADIKPTQRPSHHTSPCRNTEKQQSF